MNTHSVTNALLKHGAKVNARIASRNGLRELVLAIEADGRGVPASKDIIQILLARGADVNAPAAAAGCLTALQAATDNKDVELVKILLHKGADVNGAASAGGSTALQIAAKHGIFQLIFMFLEQGVSINAPRGGRHGRTALEMELPSTVD